MAVTATVRLRRQGARVQQVAGSLFPLLLGFALVAMVVAVALQSGPSIAGAQLKNGLVIGAIYALVAIGYTMVYGIVELINFAHGDVFTLSGFYAVLFQQALGAVGFNVTAVAATGLLGLAAVLAILFPATMVAAGITGVLIERVAYRRLRNAPRLSPLITAIGVSFIIEGMLFAKFGSNNVRTGKDTWLPGVATSFGGVTVSWKEIFVIATALGFMVMLQMFVSFARLGKAMRATAQDRDAARLCGIPVDRTIAMTFFIGSALAAAGAMIYSVYYDSLIWNLGFRLGIIAFTAAVLGGIGNIVGASAGGFLIGLISVFTAQLIGGQWSNAVVFAMLIVVLTLRPTGLLGMRVADRG